MNRARPARPPGSTLILVILRCAFDRLSLNGSKGPCFLGLLTRDTRTLEDVSGIPRRVLSSSQRGPRGPEGAIIVVGQARVDPDGSILEGLAESLSFGRLLEWRGGYGLIMSPDGSELM